MCHNASKPLPPPASCESRMIDDHKIAQTTVQHTQPSHNTAAAPSVPKVGQRFYGGWGKNTPRVKDIDNDC